MARKKTLEAQLIDLLDANDLDGLSLGVSRLDSGRIFFSANAHAKGRLCTGAEHKFPTLAETVGNAIARMHALRSDQIARVGFLEPMQEPVVDVASS